MILIFSHMDNNSEDMIWGKILFRGGAIYTGTEKKKMAQSNMNLTYQTRVFAERVLSLKGKIKRK